MKKFAIIVVIAMALAAAGAQADEWTWVSGHVYTQGGGPVENYVVNVGLFIDGINHPVGQFACTTDASGYYHGSYYGIGPDSVYRINPVTGQRGERFWLVNGGNNYHLDVYLSRDPDIFPDDPFEQGDGKSLPDNDEDKAWGAVKSLYR